MKNISGKYFGFCSPCIFFLYIAVVLSCQNNNKKTLETKTQEEGQIVGKIFQIPDSIQVFAPFEGYLLDSNEMFNSKIRIYSYLNVSCATCLDEIAKWNVIANEAKIYKVPVILILQSKDRYEILKYLIEQKQLKPFAYPFVFDLKKGYFKVNKFLNESERLYTVLTNEKNKILWSGDPIYADSVKNNLLTKLAQLSKKM